MGSEMCIRDRLRQLGDLGREANVRARASCGPRPDELRDGAVNEGCLLYTSDAADERSSGDLGGGRIIKKKKEENRTTVRPANNA